MCLREQLLVLSGRGGQPRQKKGSSIAASGMVHRALDHGEDQGRKAYIAPLGGIPRGTGFSGLEHPNSTLGRLDSDKRIDIASARHKDLSRAVVCSGCCGEYGVCSEPVCFL